MSSELDDADRCTLVRLYRSHKVLWDKNHCDFTNSKTRSKAIEKIVAASHIPDLTKAKATLFFRNMRREFYSKLLQGQLTQTYLQTTKWKWLKIANQFLNVDNQPKKPHSTALMRDKSEHVKNVELIGHYKQEELLWNTNLPQYKIRAMREAAWHRIVDKMDIQGLTPDDVRIKIKNLRTVYHKHYRQGGHDSFANSPPWMPAMDEFLRPILFDGDTGAVKTYTKPLDFDDDELNLAIMECYRQQTVLWHPLEPYFGNRTVTDQAWDECVQQMGSRVITRKDFQRLLKSLVARYSRKRSKIHADDVAAFCPNLKWFHLAESFLGPIMFRQEDGHSVTEEVNNEDEDSDDSEQQEDTHVPQSVEPVEEVRPQ
jgi:Alcohol dehydrogenase transcription factor Myb/SANT-like